MADLLPALRRCGAETLALVHDHRFGRRRAPYQSDSSDVVRVPCYGTFLYAPLSPAFPLALAKSVRAFSPDVLHLHMPNTSAFWALTLSGTRRLPWVIHWHSDVVPSSVDRRLMVAYAAYHPLEQALLRRARTVIATSMPYLLSSQTLTPFRLKSTVIPLGVDQGRLPLPDRCEVRWANQCWGSSGLRVLAVGRLTYYKGHEVLIRAAASLRVPLRVLVVGHGSRYPVLQELTVRLGLRDRLKFLGVMERSRLLALLATCDCLCLPSIERTEAFGLVLPEAMRYGKPVVAADVPGSGIGWVVQHEKSGLLVRSGDHEDLTAALERLACAPGLKERLGTVAGKRFLSEFQIDRVAAKIHQIYSELLHNS